MTSQFTPPPSDQPITRAVGGAYHRARAARMARRAAQFNKFRLIQLNLVPLVDTFGEAVSHARMSTVLQATALCMVRRRAGALRGAVTGSGKRA